MKKYIFSGLAALLLGVGFGFVAGYWQSQSSLRAPSEVEGRSNPAVVIPATSSNEIASSPPAADPRNDSGMVSGASNPESLPVAKPAPESAVKPAVKSAVARANPCEQAKKDLDVALAAAAKSREEGLTAAKQTYDTAVADLQAKLNDLTTARSQAVNDYLTAIALATSKYNSSKAADAYQVYQTEQAAALDAYAKKIAEITAAEGPLQKAKQDAEARHTAATASVEIKFASDKETAAAAYAARGCN